MNNEKMNQIIDEVYKKYTDKYIGYEDVPIKELFIHEIKKNSDNFNFALETMNESEILKIEDVLPHIMGNIKIEVFKKEITQCINIYENNI